MRRDSVELGFLVRDFGYRGYRVVCKLGSTSFGCRFQKFIAGLDCGLD